MTQHVYTRISGFQLRVIPYAPYRVTRTMNTQNSIDIEYFAPNATRFARVIPNDGGFASKTDHLTSSLFDVVDVHAGPELPEWRLETSVFSCAWPHGYAVCSNNFPHDPSPFDLIGDNGELIYVQKPLDVPAIESMRAPYQSIVRLDRQGQSGLIELEYSHENAMWCQYHEVVTISNQPIVVTMQTPTRFKDNAINAAVEVARSLYIQ